MKRYQMPRPDGATVSATIYPSRADRDGTPLIFVPGWLCDARTWDATALRLSSERPCVTLDLPGFGTSHAGDRDRWSLAGFGADVAELVETLGFDRAILVGHSMGGAVALEAAIVAPDRVAKVVAVDSFVYPAFYDLTPEEQIEPIVASFAHEFPTAIASAMQAYVRPDSPPETQSAVEDMAKADAGRGLAILRDFLRWDVEARLARAQTPVSIIAAQDFLTPEAVQRWNGHGVKCLDGVGHFIMLDAPDRFDRALLTAVEAV